MDTLGLIWGISVHSAHISESRGARLLLLRLFRHCHTLEKILVDGGYFPVLFTWAFNLFRCPVEVVKRTGKGKGFQVLPKRWIVERTFGWLNWQRRLAKDYEHRIQSSEAWVKIAMINLMIRKLERSR